MKDLAIHCLGGCGCAVRRPNVIFGMLPERADEPRTAGIVPAGEQPVTEHVVDEKPVDRLGIAVGMFGWEVQAQVQDHVDLNLREGDGGGLERFAVLPRRSAGWWESNPILMPRWTTLAE